MNGSGANTEGGRLNRSISACVGVSSRPFCPAVCNKYPTTPQAPITQASGNRTSDLALGCAGAKGGVTAERVQQLLRASMMNNFTSETSRIERLQQKTIACNPPSATPVPIIILQCPPLPPVPGPPYVCKPSRVNL
jgi:hypothetical protein